MSIEFGVLREESTITFMGEYRVDLDEALFDDLVSFFTLVGQRTAQSLDKYGGASFTGDKLAVLIEETSAMASRVESRSPAGIFLSELLRVACYAKDTQKSVEFHGL